VKFSLVVTCFNEMRGLPRWRRDIEAQTREPDEIIVVDSESTDGTTESLRDWARSEPRVRVIVQKCKPAQGHNIGNEAATYDIILSADMGIRLAPVWCEELMKPLEEDASVEVVAGNTQIDWDTVHTASARAEYYIEKGGFANLGPGFVVSNRSVAYLKRVWREVGGLPEDLTFYADDSVFGRQILQGKYKMAFAPAAMTYWGRHTRLQQFFRESFNYGRGSGEANIMKPYAVRLWQQGYVPGFTVPWLTACRFLQQRLFGGGLWRALKARDLPAFLLVPVLAFGTGYFRGKGYLQGTQHGAKSCHSCRQRLRPEFRV
jgi:glycosyltransferase involved in cell wall biosynthesis